MTNEFDPSGLDRVRRLTHVDPKVVAEMSPLLIPNCCQSRPFARAFAETGSLLPGGACDLYAHWLVREHHTPECQELRCAWLEALDAFMRCRGYLGLLAPPQPEDDDLYDDDLDEEPIP